MSSSTNTLNPPQDSVDPFELVKRIRHFKHKDPRIHSSLFPEQHCTKHGNHLEDLRIYGFEQDWLQKLRRVQDRERFSTESTRTAERRGRSADWSACPRLNHSNCDHAEIRLWGNTYGIYTSIAQTFEENGNFTDETANLDALFDYDVYLQSVTDEFGTLGRDRPSSAALDLLVQAIETEGRQVSTALDLFNRAFESQRRQPSARLDPLVQEVRKQIRQPSTAFEHLAQAVETQERQAMSWLTT